MPTNYVTMGEIKTAEGAKWQKAVLLMEDGGNCVRAILLDGTALLTEDIQEYEELHFDGCFQLNY